MHKTTLILFLMAFSSASFAQKVTGLKLTKKSNMELRADRKQPSLFTRIDAPRKDLAVSLTLNKEFLNLIWDTEPAKIQVEIPLPGGGSEKMELVRAAVLTEDFAVTTSDGRKLVGKEFQGLHYQRKAMGNKKIGAFTFREGGVFGVFSTEKGNFNVGEFSPGKGDYVVSKDSDQEHPEWNCGSDDLEDLKKNEAEGKEDQNKSAAQICKTVRIYFEADFDLYTRAGNSIATASTFVIGLFNVVAQIYQNEGITIQMSGIYQWTGTDPYKAMTNANTVLFNFATNRPPASINGDLTHLISARSSSLGGIAYVGVFCNVSVRHGFSSIYYQYSALPSYSWSVYCVAHEIGHNFGSKHTHWCGWSLPNGTVGRIDSCAAGEGTCGTVTKARKGTIMSYCHLTSSGVDLNLGFGTLPGDAIRNGLTNAACVTGSSCLANSLLSVDSVTNKNGSYILTLSVPANHNATSWEVLEGTTVIQSGTVSGTTAFTRVITITGKSNGTYNYIGRLASGSNSTTSPTVSVLVAIPAPVVSSGNCTATGLQAWFDAVNKVNFKFGLSSTCNTYAVQICRYNLTNPSVVPSAGAIPVACGIRNNMSAYTPTAAERAANLIERVANPQPSSLTTPGVGSFWYSVDVTCTGTGCSTTNRTRTYIFVPGI